MRDLLTDFGLTLLALVVILQLALFGLLAMCLDNFFMGVLTGVGIAELPNLKNINR